MPLPNFRPNRRHFLMSTTAAATALASRRVLAVANGNVRLGIIGCGWRGGTLMDAFDQVDGAEITAVCDADQDRMAVAGKRYPNASQYQDLRNLLDDPKVDAVVIATCNHWHCLATIWAMQAGKDVYVEKPLSHTQWEGIQAVNAARKYDRIVQLGTQQRSDPMQAEIKTFLHQTKSLGTIQSVHVNRFGIRPSIGKRSEPLKVGKEVAYDLWLGPAADRPLFRDALHYDWHWDWNTGSGEMGNWGVHLLDDVRNTVFQDSVPLPSRILAGGGRVGFNDAGQTPNVHLVYLETGDIPTTISLSNLPAEPGGKKSPAHVGPPSGYVVRCEGGHFEGQRGRGRAFDSDGKLMAKFSGSGDLIHQQNFIDAVRAGDRSLLNAEVANGNDSTGWCNLANVAARCGERFDRASASQFDSQPWQHTIKLMDDHLKAHGSSIDSGDLLGGQLLTVNETSGRFEGDHAEGANRFLRREYRQGFEVPEIA